MALIIELIFFGVLPIAFALWQLHDVRRARRRRPRHGADDAGSPPS